jgi:hypothetical protein
MSSPPSSGCLPLSRFEQLHTLDVGQAQHAVTEAFCPHRLTALDKARQFETRFHSVRTSDVSLSYLDYGGRVHIAPYEQESFYLVLVPLAGRAEHSTQGDPPRGRADRIACRRPWRTSPKPPASACARFRKASGDSWTPLR